MINGYSLDELAQIERESCVTIVGRNRGPSGLNQQSDNRQGKLRIVALATLFVLIVAGSLFWVFGRLSGE